MAPGQLIPCVWSNCGGTSCINGCGACKACCNCWNMTYTCGCHNCNACFVGGCKSAQCVTQWNAKMGACSIDEYEIVAANASEFPQCVSITQCEPTQFESAPPTPTSDRKCTDNHTVDAPSVLPFVSPTSTPSLVSTSLTSTFSAIWNPSVTPTQGPTSLCNGRPDPHYCSSVLHDIDCDVSHFAQFCPARCPMFCAFPKDTVIATSTEVPSSLSQDHVQGAQDSKVHLSHPVVVVLVAIIALLSAVTFVTVCIRKSNTDNTGVETGQQDTSISEGEMILSPVYGPVKANSVVEQQQVRVATIHNSTYVDMHKFSLVCGNNVGDGTTGTVPDVCADFRKDPHTKVGACKILPSSSQAVQFFDSGRNPACQAENEDIVFGFGEEVNP